MHKRIYIGIAALSGVTIGALMSLQKKTKEEPCHSCDQEHTNNDQLGAFEDSFVMGKWTSKEKNTTAYKRLLKKWGTKKGLVEAGNSLSRNNKKSKIKLDKKTGLIEQTILHSKKQKSEQLKSIKRMSNILTKTHKYVTSKNQEFTSLKSFYSYLNSEYETTQVSVTNTSDITQKVKLWGANTIQKIPKTKTFQIENILTGSTEIHPQNVVFNPVNGYFYVVNQLSDSVSVISSKNQVITHLKLDETQTLIGSISPVDLAVNTITTSSNYGNIYVIGSVSNMVYEINLQYKVVSKTETGIRPIAIVFNPINESVYTANIVSNDITKLDTKNKETITLGTYAAPIALGINEQNGSIYVLSSTNKVIHVIELILSDSFLKNTIDVATGIGGFAFHPLLNKMYFTATDRDVVLAFDSETHQISNTIAVEESPLRIVYNTSNELLYIANKGSQNISLISTEDTVVETLELGAFSNGLAIGLLENDVFLTDTTSGDFSIGKTLNNAVITFNDDYNEYREDFQHNPAIIKHLKVITSNRLNINALQLVKKTVTGKETCVTYSFRKYDSPQNFSNVSEVYDIKGTIIDGRNSWCFNLAAKQKVTFLIYHKQLETYDLLPETARKSTGVEMSKGLPKHWKQL